MGVSLMPAVLRRPCLSSVFNIMPALARAHVPNERATFCLKTSQRVFFPHDFFFQFYSSYYLRKPHSVSVISIRHSANACLNQYKLQGSQPAFSILRANGIMGCGAGDGERDGINTRFIVLLFQDT